LPPPQGFSHGLLIPFEKSGDFLDIHPLVAHPYHFGSVFHPLGNGRCTAKLEQGAIFGSA
jgi:hypothetical protein